MNKEQTKRHFERAQIRMILRGLNPKAMHYWRAQSTRLRKRLEQFT